MASFETRRPRGRRGGESDAAQVIHEAAVSLFAELGYDATSIRAIAERASVDPALVHHYFGQKDQLYATVLSLPDRDRLMEHLCARVDAGEVDSLIREVLVAWDDPTTRQTMLARLRSATRTGVAGEAAGDYVAALFHGDGDLERAAQPSRVAPEDVGAVAAGLLGLVIARHVLKIDPLASASSQDAVALWGPTIRALLVSSIRPSERGVTCPCCLRTTRGQWWPRVAGRAAR